MHILQSFRICSTMTFRTYWTSSILNHETVTGSKFLAEYIYNAFALKYWRITVFFLWFLQYNCLFTMGAPGIVVARRGGLRAQRAMSGQRNHEKPVCGFNLAPKKEDICGSPLTRNFFMGGLNVGYSKW